MYTLEIWGIEQADKYDQDFFDALARLEAFPNLGKSAPSLGQSIRVLRVNRHVVIYKAQDDELLVVRVAHIRSRPVTELDL